MSTKPEHDDSQVLDDPAWPPGTVLLEAVTGRAKDGTVILQPRPSDDPNDPLNWPQWRKHWNFFLVCFYTFMVFALIDAATPTWGPMQDELGYSTDMLNNAYAIGCGTLAIGAFMFIPFALKFGRRPVYVISTIVQFAASIWAAEEYTVGDLLGWNALSCLVGALAEVLVQMTVADVYFVHERGVMNSWFVWAQYVGSGLSTLAAGYITDGQGWRWTWWWCAIFFGVAFVVYVFGYEETKFNHIQQITGVPSEIERVATRGSISNAPAEKEKPIQSSDPSPDLEAVAPIDAEAAGQLSVTHINPSIPRKTYWQCMTLTTTSPGNWSEFIRHSYQPFWILVTIPAVAYMSLVYGVVISWSTVMVVTLSSWMLEPPWNFDASQIGLMSLAPFVGLTLGSLGCGWLSDRVILKLAARNGGVFEPEMRLWVMVPFMPFLPIGAFLFGYGLNNGWGWPVIAVAYGLSNFGSAPIASIAITYLTDAYTEIIGDSLVSVTFTRNAISTIFVFALSPWIDAVGMGNVYTTIGVIGIAVLGFVFVFIWKGKTFRHKSAKRYRYFAARQYEARRV